MDRTYVVTGAASGIGKATAELLVSRGDRVISVDLKGADVTVDLTSVEGRTNLADAVGSLSDGPIDGILAIAGVSAMEPSTVAMNYFGTIATLEGLRPLLHGSKAPRAVAVSSLLSLFPVDDALVALMAAQNEGGALERAAELASTDAGGLQIYPSTKRGLAQWIRRTAPTPDWAGASIPLNAIAPGVILTPMTAAVLDTEEGREQITRGCPMPLNGFADPIVPARLLAWLVSEENTHLCGQVIFIDGGSDALTRGDSTW